jgi:murein DD-endopeptidase MepM/ murein hydrolase activator NlpD
MARSLRHAGADGGFRRPLCLPAAATIFCLLQFLALAPMAHVRTPDYGPLGRKMEAGQPGIGSVPRLNGQGEGQREGRGANEQSFVRPTQACGLSFDAQRLSADAMLVASVLGAPTLSEVRLDSVRAAAAPYREVLSHLDGFGGAADIVLVTEGVTPEGVSCPLFVSVGSGASRQTFWRFAPDDEPGGWFDEGGWRLGDAALATPRPGSRISSPFGPRRYYGRPSGGGFHNGIDYEARVGDPIFAAADGVIEHRGGHFEYGLTVKIRHAAQYTTLYAHMSRFANGIAVGAAVRKGELIGYVGMTGRSTGAHLHFSTILNDKFVNPAPYLSDNGNRSLSAPALATFRQWQQEVRDAVNAARERRLRPQSDELDWTMRI